MKDPNVSVMAAAPPHRPTLLVLASTYPRYAGDHEPGFVHELCRRLVPHFDVIVLVPDAPDCDADGLRDGVMVVHYRYAPRRFQTLVHGGGIAANLRRSRWKWLLVPLFVAGQLVAALRIIRKQPVDLVHAHWLLPQGMVARLLGRPYVVTSHGGDLYGLRAKPLLALKRWVAASASTMTVVSSAMREEASRSGIQSSRIEVLPMGVDLAERFVPDESVERAPDTLLFVGRLVAKKGLKYLIEAMPLVLAQRPGVILQIAGFGPEESTLREMAERLGLASSIRFLGAIPQSELPSLYRRSALFVAPFIRDDSGDQEGLPVVLMEAIGCGCPVVVGDVAGIADLLGSAVSEVSVNPRDRQALATAILTRLDNPQRAAEVASSVRSAASLKVDWSVVADGYARCLLGSLPEAGGGVGSRLRT